MGRALAVRLSVLLGQNVVVDNRAGGGGTIGSRMVAKAVPDGYTLLVGVSGPLAIAPHIYDDIGFDPIKDLAPIAMINISPFVLIAHPSVAATNIKELIALAKSTSLRYASTGIGGTPHLSGELLKSLAGIDLVHVPYSGGPPAMTSVLGGEAHMYFTGVAAASPFVRAGKVRALGMAGLRRSDALPEVPTIAEQGLRGFDVAGWQGLLAPAGTPAAVIRRLYSDTTKVLNSPEFKEFVVKAGAESISMDPAQFAAYLREDTEKWRKVVKAAGGIKPQ